MNHAALVRVVERVRHLARDLQSVLERQLLVALQPVAQRLALHVGHDVVQDACGFAGVVDGDDVGVIERGGDLDLAQEPLGAECRGELGSHDFDGYLAAVLQVLGEMDDGHPPRAERALQAVAVGDGLGEALVVGRKHVLNMRPDEPPTSRSNSSLSPPGYCLTFSGNPPSLLLIPTRATRRACRSR